MDRPPIPDIDDAEPAKVVIIDGDAYREQRLVVRRFMAAIVGLVAIGMGSVVWTQVTVISNQDSSATRGKEILNVSKDVRRTLQLIEGVTSPEASARQAEVLRATIAAIGCDNRAALQDLLDQLIERGILAPGDATIACPAPPATPTTPGTTTTTEVPR